MLKAANSHVDEVGASADCHEVLAGSFESGLLLLCDHASNQFPPEYGTLGLPQSELERHIAYDIGAAGVTRGLSALLNVPAVLTRYSRLLIDPNRSVDDPTLIMQLSDGAVVAGNSALDATERAKRVRHYYEPYHSTIDALIDRFMDAGVVPILLSIHSFTECWKETPRPWHITVLWDRDPRLPKPMLKRLSKEEALIVGENEPYSGQLKGDCLYRHASMRGFAHALLEIRQDLIRAERDQVRWAERLARTMTELLQDNELVADLRRVKHHGSHARGRSSQRHRH